MQHRSFNSKLGGTVEVDETYIGGKARNMHATKREKLKIRKGRSWAGKIAVMGLLQRHGNDGPSQVRTLVMTTLKSRGVQDLVRQHVEKGSTVNTDSFRSYGGLQTQYEHNVIDHAEKYVDGQIHTNGCENFWSLLKRAIRGTYVAVEPFRLFRYLDEQCLRFNQRKLDDAGRFLLTAASVFGRRVMYKELTGHNQQVAAAI
jgi:transposase-like protein